jgi:hypothetical protein
MERTIEGSEFNQSTLYVCMEISQWNFSVELIYPNKKDLWRKQFFKNTFVKTLKWKDMPSSWIGRLCHNNFSSS